MLGKEVVEVLKSRPWGLHQGRTSTKRRRRTKRVSRRSDKCRDRAGVYRIHHRISRGWVLKGIKIIISRTNLSKVSSSRINQKR